MIGFCPQDNILIIENTVEEAIRFSARVRLPSLWSNEKVDEFTNLILSVLNLSHVSDNVLGGVVDSGVSGGQRRRVNIGLELAAAPAFLILDQPTSGLDSTSSLNVNINFIVIFSYLICLNA